MTDDEYNGHHYPRAKSWIDIDPGAQLDKPPACTLRPWCILEAKHGGDCQEVASSRYEYPKRPPDHRLKAHPKEAKPPTPAADVVWPVVGARFQDSEGRVLTIIEVHHRSANERHVVGTLDDGASYACSLIVFDMTWKEIR